MFKKMDIQDTESQRIGICNKESNRNSKIK